MGLRHSDAFSKQWSGKAELAGIKSYLSHIYFLTRGGKSGHCFPLTLKHVPVGIVSNGVDVWGHLCPSPSLIHVHHLGRVDGEPPVRVHCHAEEPGVGLETNSNMRRQAEFDHLGQYY